MTTLTPPKIDIDAMRAAIATANVEPDPEPVIARRVNMGSAREHFAAGGDVLVSEYGDKSTVTVGPNTTVHNRVTTTWDALRKEVAEWRHRYPNQRYYIIPGTTQAAPEPEPAKPSLPRPVLEAQAPLGEAIDAALTKLYPGDSQVATDRRNKIRAAIAAELSELFVYGIDLDGRLPIGEPIDLGNAYVEVDGFGNAVRILCGGGDPIWNPEGWQ